MAWDWTLSKETYGLSSPIWCQHSTVHNQGLNDKGGGRKCFTYATGLEGIANNDDESDYVRDQTGLPNSKRVWTGERARQVI